MIAQVNGSSQLGRQVFLNEAGPSVGGAGGAARPGEVVALGLSVVAHLRGPDEVT